MFLQNTTTKPYITMFKLYINLFELLKQAFDSLGTQCVADIKNHVENVFFVLINICETQKKFNIKISDSETDMNETLERFKLMFYYFDTRHKTLNVIGVNESLNRFMLVFCVSSMSTIWFLVDSNREVYLSNDYKNHDSAYEKARFAVFSAHHEATRRLSTQVVDQVSISKKSEKWADIVEKETAPVAALVSNDWTVVNYSKKRRNKNISLKTPTLI